MNQSSAAVVKKEIDSRLASAQAQWSQQLSEQFFELLTVTTTCTALLLKHGSGTSGCMYFVHDSLKFCLYMLACFQARKLQFGCSKR